MSEIGSASAPTPMPTTPTPNNSSKNNDDDDNGYNPTDVNSMMANKPGSDDKSDQKENPLMQALKDTIKSVQPGFMSPSSSDSDTSPSSMSQGDGNFGSLDSMNMLSSSHNAKQPGGSQFGSSNSASSGVDVEEIAQIAVLA